MQIPAFCANWHVAMSANADDIAILAHIASENCVDAGVAAKFWAELAKTPVVAGAARDVGAKAVVSAEAQFSGPEVTDPLFRNLARIVGLRALARVAGATYSDLQKRVGWNDGSFRNTGILEGRYLAPLERELDRLGARLSNVRLTNQIGVVFVCPAYDDILDLSDTAARQRAAARLALGWQTGDLCFLIHYPKSDVPGDRVFRPTSLDAINQPMFRPVANCAAPYGMTAPGGVATGGLPEAVHRSADLTQVPFFYFIVA